VPSATRRQHNTPTNNMALRYRGRREKVPRLSMLNSQNKEARKRVKIKRRQRKKWRNSLVDLPCIQMYIFFFQLRFTCCCCFRAGSMAGVNDPTCEAREVLSLNEGVPAASGFSRKKHVAQTPCTQLQSHATRHVPRRRHYKQIKCHTHVSLALPSPNSCSCSCCCCTWSPTSPSPTTTAAP